MHSIARSLTGNLQFAIPEAIKEKERNLVPVQKITELYGISQSKVYYMFRTAQLDKYKQGGLTFVDTYQLESRMKVQNLVRAARAIKDSKKKQIEEMRKTRK